jgi:hypothetical protein
MVYINLPEGPITSEWARDEADRLAGEWPDAVTDEQQERLWMELGDLIMVARAGKGRKPGQEGLTHKEDREFARYLMQHWSPREQDHAYLGCMMRIFDIDEARRLARKGKTLPRPRNGGSTRGGTPPGAPPGGPAQLRRSLPMSRSPDWAQATERADAPERLARQPLASSPARPHDGPITTVRSLAGRAGRLGGARQRWRADGQRERGRHGQNTHAWHPSRPGGHTWSGCASACWLGPAGLLPEGEDDHRPCPQGGAPHRGRRPGGPGRSS